MSGSFSGIKVQQGLKPFGLYNGTEEFKEGVKTFLEKRPPNFLKYTKTRD